MNKFLLFFLSILYPLVSVSTESQPEGVLPQHTVFIDNIHAHNFLNAELTPDSTNYNALFGLSDITNYLKRQGIRVVTPKKGLINSRRLEDVDTLLINRVSDDLPVLRIEEVAAIKDFVEKGGKLFLVLDQANIYHHAHRLEGLLTEFGINTYFGTAMDAKPNIIGERPDWLAVDRLALHHLMENLDVLAMASSAVVHSQYSLAALSKESWSDVPVANSKKGLSGHLNHFGNRTKDAGEKAEYISVISLVEFGEGHVVLIGDQNMLGNLGLRLEDNYKFMLNLFAWTSQNNKLKDYKQFITNNKASIVLLDDITQSSFINDSKWGFYNAYTVLAKSYNTFVRSSLDDYPYDLVIVSQNPPEWLPEHTDRLKALLMAGKNIAFLSLKKELSEKSKIIFADVTEGLKIDKEETIDNQRIIHYQSAGNVVFLNGIQKYNNQRIEAPTKTPDMDYKDREDEWLERVGNLIIKKDDVSEVSGL